MSSSCSVAAANTERQVHDSKETEDSRHAGCCNETRSIEICLEQNKDAHVPGHDTSRFDQPAFIPDAGIGGKYKYG